MKRLWPFVALALVSGCTYYPSEYARMTADGLQNYPVETVLAQPVLIGIYGLMTVADTLTFGSFGDYDKEVVEQQKREHEQRMRELHQEHNNSRMLAARVAKIYGSRFDVVCHGRGVRTASRQVYGAYETTQPTYERSERTSARRFEFFNGAEWVSTHGSKTSIGGGLSYRIGRDGETIIAEIDDQWATRGETLVGSVYFGKDWVSAEASWGHDGKDDLREVPSDLYGNTKLVGTDVSWDTEGTYDNCEVKPHASRPATEPSAPEVVGPALSPPQADPPQNPDSDYHPVTGKLMCGDEVCG